MSASKTRAASLSRTPSTSIAPHRLFEEEAAKVYSCVAGVDEAGRGALAGPVVAAAVVLKSDATNLEAVRDSKLLRSSQREELVEIIKSQSKYWGVGIVDHLRIDEINILQATFEAMDQALTACGPEVDYALIDGNRYRHSTIPFKTVIDGDVLSVSIAAASIIAKVTRDALMVELDSQFPNYGFAKHKGYGTLAHRTALKEYGPSQVHRRSFIGRILTSEESFFEQNT